MRRAGFSPHEKLYVNFRKHDGEDNMTFSHYHDAYEIYFLLRGKVHYFADNVCYILESGDVIVHKPFELHYCQNRGGDFSERYVLNFHREELSILLNDVEIDILIKKLNSGIIHLSHEQSEVMFELFRKVDEYCRRKGFLAEKLTYCALLELLMHVVEWMDKNNVSEKAMIAPEIMMAISYINKNYKEKLGLDEIAEEVGMSKYYFCRLFRSLTGVTVIEYINNERLIKAHSLLVNTKMSIEEIAVRTGFGGGSNFARAFKKAYGTSPRSFRNREHEKQAAKRS